MKYLLFFLFIPFFGQAQIVKGIVKEKTSKEGISFLTVAIENSDVYVLTNENGEFQFNLSDIKGKNIIVNNIYFEPFLIKVNDGNFINIELTELSFTLEEMVVYNQPIKRVFEDIISNSEKKIKTNVKMQTYYKEDYFKDGKKYFFADGLVDFCIKNKSTKIDAVVRESRLVDSNTNKQLNEVDLEYSAAIDVNDVMESSMRFKILRKILKDKNYEFVVTSKKARDKTLHTLYIEPKEEANERFLFSGKVVFNESEQLIYELDLKFAEEFKKYNTEINAFILKIKIHDLKRKVKYNFVNGSYYVTYSDVYFDFDVSRNKGKLNERFKGNSEIITLGVENTSNFPAKDQVYTKKQLYKNGNKYSYEFWNDELIKNYVK